MDRTRTRCISRPPRLDLSSENEAEIRRRTTSSMWDKGFDPFQVFEVEHEACLDLEIKILKGEAITKGSTLQDLMDTPDPYVILRIPGCSNPSKRTSHVDNCTNPIWDESFHFYLDPAKEHNLKVVLMDANYTMDEVLGEDQFCINQLTNDVPFEHTFVFPGGSKVYALLKMEKNKTPDLRFSLALCKEEKDFLLTRRMKVLASMQKVLGSRAPDYEKQVPIIGILGSGGGFRAMTCFSGAIKALHETGILDCVTYISALSGSSWYISTLYAHDDFPNVTHTQIQRELRDSVTRDWKWFLLSAPKYVASMVAKYKMGQPVSFTDFFGHLLGDVLLKGHKHKKLTDTQRILVQGVAPLPLYTCLHAKKNVSCRSFSEWVEFSPYEIGIAKYGTFMKTQDFGNKFIVGKKIKHFEELPLHFLQGVWGSAFTILIKRLVMEGGKKDIIQIMRDAQKLDNIEDMMDDSHSSGESSDTEAEEEIEGKDDNSGEEEEMEKRNRRSTYYFSMTSLSEEEEEEENLGEARKISNGKMSNEKRKISSESRKCNETRRISNDETKLRDIRPLSSELTSDDKRLSNDETKLSEDSNELTSNAETKLSNELTSNEKRRLSNDETKHRPLSNELTSNEKRRLSNDETKLMRDKPLSNELTSNEGRRLSNDETKLMRDRPLSNEKRRLSDEKRRLSNEELLRDNPLSNEIRKLNEKRRLSNEETLSNEIRRLNERRRLSNDETKLTRNETDNFNERSKFGREGKKYSTESDPGLMTDYEGLQETRLRRKGAFKNTTRQQREETATSSAAASATLPAETKPKKDVFANHRKTLRESRVERKAGLWEGLKQSIMTGTNILNSRAGRAGEILNPFRGLSLRHSFPISPFALDAMGSDEDQEDVVDSEMDIGAGSRYKPLDNTAKKLFIVDSGLAFNSPYPLLLRPQRAVDIYLSFDFSQRPTDATHPFKELLLAEKWATQNKVPFPPIQKQAEEYEKDPEVKECYIFKHPTDQLCPVILHFPLVNNTFKHFKAPGVPRETDEEKAFADFPIFDDPLNPYSSMNFVYEGIQFDRLTQLVTYNTLLCTDIIKDEIADIITRKKRDIPKLKLRDVVKSVKRLSSLKSSSSRDLKIRVSVESERELRKYAFQNTDPDSSEDEYSDAKEDLTP